MDSPPFDALYQNSFSAKYSNVINTFVLFLYKNI